MLSVVDVLGRLLVVFGFLAGTFTCLGAVSGRGETSTSVLVVCVSGWLAAILGAVLSVGALVLRALERRGPQG